MDVGPSEAETFWTDFLRKFARRGLRGVKLVISDAHEGIKVSASKAMNATWQRRRVNFMRNRPGPGQPQRAARRLRRHRHRLRPRRRGGPLQWRRVADQLRPKVPKLAALMDQAEPDVLADMGFPAAHRVKLHSTNPLERFNGEIKRRTEVVGIFLNADAITRLVGAIRLEQNDAWAVQRSRYMILDKHRADRR